MGSDTSETAGLRVAAGLPRAIDELRALTDGVIGSNKQLVFFLDYDGTLAPIVTDPDKAHMPATTRGVLAELARAFPTTIVTGRAKSKVKNFVGVDGLAYAGSHGFDIEAPNCKMLVAETEKPKLSAAFQRLSASLDFARGYKLEDNNMALSVHYRHVAEGAERDATLSRIEALVDELKLALHHGKMVWEIRPNIEWNKGRALEFLMYKLKIDGDEYMPVFIGDDVTDEDAFGALEPKNGVGVIVFGDCMKEQEERPRETKAIYRLSDPGEVCAFLNAFVEKAELKRCNGVRGLVEKNGIAEGDGNIFVGANAAS